MVAWSLGFPSPDGESAMPKENAVENIWLWWPRFRDAGGIRRELLDQVIRAIDALNKVTLSGAEHIWHEPTQFGDVKDYLNTKKMYLERKLSLTPQSPLNRASDQVVATEAQ